MSEVVPYDPEHRVARGVLTIIEITEGHVLSGENAPHILMNGTSVRGVQGIEVQMPPCTGGIATVTITMLARVSIHPDHLEATRPGNYSQNLRERIRITEYEGKQEE